MGRFMKGRSLTIPELILIAGTRVALGAGVGLILADKLDDSERRGAGWALLAVGLLTTIPIALNVLTKGAQADHQSESSVERLVEA